MSSVLYDVPGPRAIARNRVLGILTVIVVAAVLGFFLWRMFETGQFTASKWEAFTYVEIWIGFLGATGRTLAAFGVAAVGALVFSFVLALGRMSDHAIVRVPFTALVETLRAVPVLIYMLLLYYGLPVVGLNLNQMPGSEFLVQIGIRPGQFWAVVLALVAYNASVLAEVIRAGVESLPRGQREAGYAIGLRKSGVMRLVLLPQAIRAMMPVIVAQLVVTLKDTALGFILTYEELLYYARAIGRQVSLDSPLIPATIVAAAIYISLCLALSAVANAFERRLRRSPRTPNVVRADAAGRDVTTTQVLAAQQDGGQDAEERGANPGR